MKLHRNKYNIQSSKIYDAQNKLHGLSIQLLIPGLERLHSDYKQIIYRFCRMPKHYAHIYKII